MSIPGFNADASLGPTRGTYRRQVAFDGSATATVLPMAAKTCGKCEVVGAFGTIRGVGRRACSRTVWKYDPITKRYTQTTEQWFESCTPEREVNRWFRF